MSTESCRRLIIRDVAGLIRQLRAYPDEGGLWSTPGGVANPPGNLALHIAGNLRDNVGRILGGIEYERDRAAEFSRSAVPVRELVAELEAASNCVDATLREFPDARLEEPFPMDVGGVQLTVGRFLIHICGHLAYHLGQVDAHRRITTGEGAIDGMQGLDPLAG